MADTPPLVISLAGPSGTHYELGDGRSAVTEIARALRTAAVARDQHVCRWCGFRSRKYQEVVTLTGNLRDIDALMTACIYCKQCFHIELAGPMRSGVLIWLPEVTQGDLHHIAREIYIARISQGSQATKGRRLLDFLIARREGAKDRLTTDDPAKMAEYLRQAQGPEERMGLLKQADGIRLFPLDRRIISEADLQFNQFPQILAYWRSRAGPYPGGANGPLPWLDRAATLFNVSA